MNGIANEPSFISGSLLMLGILLVIVILAFVADGLIRRSQAKEMREEQRRAWKQFYVWKRDVRQLEPSGNSPQRVGDRFAHH